MVCHVDFSVEAIQLSSPPLSDSEIDKKAQLLWGRGEGCTKAVMSSLSVSTRSEVCRHLFALLIVRFYQVPLRVYHLYFYCIKSGIHRTHLDGKKKIDYFDSETFGIGCGLL